MFTLRPISRDSVDGSLAKAERYRLLNEPNEAESICRDILEVDPQNREARVSLILALTDQIHQDPTAFSSAVRAIGDLEGAYDRAYYSGIAWERRAKALHGAGAHGSGGHVYDWLVKALQLFDEAERLRPSRERRRYPALERLRPLSGSPQISPAEYGRRPRAHPFGVNATFWLQ